MAGPSVLFGLAEQSIDSSLARMLNAAAPVFTVLVGAFVARRLPGPLRIAGLTIAAIGVVLIGLPALSHAHAEAAGAGPVLFATALYGLAFHIDAPLQRRYGAVPVLWRAQLLALASLTPLGLPACPAPPSPGPA